MSAEIRTVARRTWVIDLACGIEEPWDGDAVGAGIRADDHNEAAHPSQSEITELEPPSSQ